MIRVDQQQEHISSDLICFKIIVTGYVQGVGFRPFVYRLANELSIKGHVTNNTGQVTIFAEAGREILQQFCERLLSDAPSNSKPQIQSVSESVVGCYKEFLISESTELSENDIHILPDLPTCNKCLDELFDKNNRRYLYPFINCTECGPRSSIITSLPYDRKNTSMQTFPLCTDCEKEYLSPTNRRFHAEPVACESCGPVLNFVEDELTVSDNKLALEKCIEALKQGKVVAVKGIGGYHLMCDATSAEAIDLLRNRKQRPDKPFALLMAQSQLDKYLDVSEQELKLLQDKCRPIVLLKNKKNSSFPVDLAPGFNRVGVMLPGNPLHHLICHYFNKPMVATSANISGEPITIDNLDAEKRLSKLCDAFLHNNRSIVRPSDDPVMVCNDAGSQLIRTGRGLSPTEYSLPFTLKSPVLAVGGHIKNTIALAWENRMVISAHNGDLSSLRGYQAFQSAINDLQKLYKVKAKRVVCDAHPGYGNIQWVNKSELAVEQIFHHHAHASSLAIENPDIENWLVFSWDGVGFGSDGSLWGGETFLGSPGNWRRVASFRPFRLPGGEKTSRQPWRIAASLCWHSDLNADFNINYAALKQLENIWKKNTYCPQTSAAGRLFSAAASLLELIDVESFEGHAPMLLEALAETGKAEALTLPVLPDGDGIFQIDWQPLVKMLKDKTMTTADRARCFHETLAECISRLSLTYSADNKNLAIGLSGGVFQNQLLLHLIKQRMQQHNLDLRIPVSIPVNDGGLSAGQVVEYYYSNESDS